MNLFYEVLKILKEENVYSEDLRMKLVLVFDGYEISEKVTGIVPYNSEGYNEKIINLFIMNKAVKGLTERSLHFYRTTLTKILNVIQKPANMVSADDIKVYLARRQLIDKVTDVTCHNEFRVLSSFYEWMLRDEQIEKNPMHKVDEPKVRKKKKKAFSTMECELIRSACLDDRERAIVEVLFSTWCRVSEVAGIKISDIKNDSVTVTGKGEKERTVYLNSKAKLAIETYLDSRSDDSPYLFVSMNKPYKALDKGWIEKIVKAIGERAGVENVHPHRFRRTGATLALKTGMRIELVSGILGHESIETTQIYLDINEDEMKQAHEKYVV